MRKVAFVAFAFGAVVGAAASWLYAKKKYELIAQEEIDSVKEAFAKMPKPDIDPDDEARQKADMMEYASKIADLGYTDYSAMTANDEQNNTKKKPYVISPDEFGEKEEYTQISLTFFADQILVDDDNVLIENVEDVVGFDSLTHFGEYEDDSVFVRNDERKCDYEILLDQRTYSDFLAKNPHKAVEVE